VNDGSQLSNRGTGPNKQGTHGRIPGTPWGARCLVEVRGKSPIDRATLTREGGICHGGCTREPQVHHNRHNHAAGDRTSEQSYGSRELCEATSSLRLCAYHGLQAFP